jgi:hypothetical protein
MLNSHWWSFRNNVSEMLMNYSSEEKNGLGRPAVDHAPFFPEEWLWQPKDYLFKLLCHAISCILSVFDAD